MRTKAYSRESTTGTVIEIANQKHDLGVKKRKLNLINNPPPLNKAARLAKRKAERLAGRDDGTERAKRYRLKKLSNNRKARDW